MEIRIKAQHFFEVTNDMSNKKPFGYVGGQNFLIPFSEVKSPQDYELPKNPQNGKKLPFCCKFHTSLYMGIKKWYEKEFPNCCENHKILASNPLYKKEDYKTVADKVVKQLSYTEHLIKTKINNYDWYDDITDYIDYNNLSFGHPISVGSSYYLNNLLAVLENESTFENDNRDKRISLINFVKSYFEPFEKVPSTDFNLLYSVYQNWLEIFPFNLSFFEGLKSHFEKQFPILLGEPKTNRYLGSVTFKVHSKESLIIHLLSVTNSIITKINSQNLLEKNLLSEPEKIKLEIILSERTLKNKVGYLSNPDNENKKFVDILNEWFADEKKFIDDVIPLLKLLPTSQVKTISNKKLTAKHHVLAYIFDCKANGEILPHGNKKELEKIGNKKLGAGKGNTFYKNYNLIINKDLSKEKILVDEIGEDWQEIILELSKSPDILKQYLKKAMP